MKRTFFTLVFLLFTVYLMAGFLPQVNAQGMDNVKGFAWSDTVGWISFNCLDINVCKKSDYGVRIAPDGTLSGYAWNDGVGWISFRGEDLSGCPYDACSARLLNNRLYGWARVLSGKDGEGGWDGWIRLGGASYGPTLSGPAFSGFAWGSDILGWISFATGEKSVVVDSKVSVTLSAVPTSLTQGDRAVLSWHSTEAVTCVGENFSTGGAVSGSVQVSPRIATEYALSCEGIGGSASASVPIAVTPALPTLSVDPSPIVEGQRATLSWNCPYASSSSGVNFSTGGKISGALSVQPATTTTYIVRCDPYGTQAGASLQVRHPSVSISAEPIVISPGGTPTLSWSSSLVTPKSCRVTGPGVSLRGESGSSVIPPVYTQSVYTISCGTDGANISATAIVNLTPTFR